MDVREASGGLLVIRVPQQQAWGTAQSVLRAALCRDAGTRRRGVNKLHCHAYHVCLPRTGASFNLWASSRTGEDRRHEFHFLLRFHFQRHLDVQGV